MSQINRPKQQSRNQASTNPALQRANQNNKQLAKIKKNGKITKKKRPQNKTKNNMVARNGLSRLYKEIKMCSLQYASALADPFGTPVGACIPFGFPLPSQKVKAFARGSFALGTTGQGFAMFLPPLGNDVTCVQTTLSTSVGTSITLLSAFTNQQQTNVTKIPYTSSQMASTVVPIEGRTVAFGARCRYSGTESNRNGVVTSIEAPNHEDLMGVNGSTIVGYVNSLNERPKPDGSWHQVNFSGPVNASELPYRNAAYPYGNTNKFMGFYVNGTAGDNYEFEFFVHNEYTGATVPGLTVSHADDQGYGTIIESMKGIATQMPLSPRNALEGFSSFVSSAGSTIKAVIRDYGIPMLAGAISPALIPMARVSSRLLLGN